MKNTRLATLLVPGLLLLGAVVWCRHQCGAVGSETAAANSVSEAAADEKQASSPSQRPDHTTQCRQRARPINQAINDPTPVLPGGGRSTGFPTPPPTRPAPRSHPAPPAAPYSPNVVGPNLLTNWQAPIEFYGKVVDQNSNAVAGATVSFHWMEVPDETGSRSTTSESDAEGLFSLQGARGPSLSVSVSKEGYYPRRGAAQYGPLAAASFAPAPENPVIFQLRKKGTPETLIAVNRSYRIPRDGTPVSIDLVTGVNTTGEIGTLVLRCWTNDQGEHSGEKYDWRCRLSIPGGGLLLTDEEFPFLAPEPGYAASTEILMAADRPDWKDDVDLKLFYRLRDGRYGRMTFSMIAGGQHFCMVDSFLNPSGSRSLETEQQ